MNATKAQTWKLFTLTKHDYRNENLTFEEADQMIRNCLNNLRLNKQKFIDAWEKAKKAGQVAIEACTPRPMAVQQHSNMLDDNSPVVKQYHVPDGVCGFAWVWLPYKDTNIKFINTIKKFDDGLRRNRYKGGYEYWVWQGNQSYEKKMAFARAMADVLQKEGIKAYAGGRLD